MNKSYVLSEDSMYAEGFLSDPGHEGLQVIINLKNKNSKI